MTDIDLDAIRARNTNWIDRDRAADAPCRDRRELLQYIDSIEAGP